MVDELNILDAWREKYLEKKQYTFYSNRHLSWSRIDMTWMSTDLFTNIQNIAIETSTWADHNPVTIIWKGQKKRTRWTLNQTILNEKDFQQYMKKEVLFFFKENKKEDTSLQNVWDTVKAYMRGLAMTYLGKKNKQKRQNKGKLEEEYKTLEKELQKDTQNKKIKNLMELNKHKMNLLENEEVAMKIKAAKQTFFEHANKPGRWLTYKIKKEKEKRWIKQLEDAEGILQHRNEEKKKIIWEYYENLYKQQTVSDDRIKHFLEETEIPKMPEKFKKLLEGEITMMELIEAINRQKNGKTPGPDGLPAELYKTLQEVLGNVMLELYNELLSEAKIPDSWSEALITLIPKEETETQKIKNYRPISLLNMDYKRFASIMVERL